MDVLQDLDFRQAILTFVRGTVAAEFANAPYPEVPEYPVLREKGACFVTLHSMPGPEGTGENLRGCIGNLQAFEALGENLRHNALNAAFRDPRFPALDPEELPEVRFEVSILSAPRPIAGPEEFQIGVHGIILQKNNRSAVFLPQVAPEQGWDRATTLRYLSMKAGLVSNAWEMPDARFFVFTATVFGE
ncbi:MAG: AmmeMemoRadiSam system protein A [Lentisphaeria bacterium]|nr:AmmeMemoRadiSam system protein A [Lentisphaeria bacterium]MBQ7394380.1 AmmeMemoRadiSam system protein A [Lentisphaeria bacterium]